MANYTPSIVVDNVIDALKAFITLFAPAGMEIVRAQDNRVPMPLDSCVVLTELFGEELGTPRQNFDPVNQVNAITGPTQIDVQMDFYGPNAGDLCKAIQAAFRARWAYDQFPQNIRPLFTSKGVQSPLVTGEQQYESRWTSTASMQYNPSMTVPQQSATQLTVTTIGLANP